jgi:hypothetical protein
MSEEVETMAERKERHYKEWQKEIKERNFKYERMDGCCEECIYFCENAPYKKAYTGECKRYPPLYCAEYLEHRPFYYPDVSSHDRCGEFKAAKKIIKQIEEW